MDEEYNDSVDTSADMDVSEADVSDDVVADIPEDVPEDIPEDVPEDIPEDVPEDNYSDMADSDDFSEDFPEESITDDAEFDEADVSIEEDSMEPETEELDEQVEDIEEDTVVDMGEVSDELAEADDISEDTDSFNEESQSEADEIEDIPEDIEDGKATDQEEEYEEDIPEDVTDAETMHEAAEVEETETDTAKQSEGVTDAEMADENTDVEDSENDTAEQPEDEADTEATDEANDVENAVVADETADVENAETTDETTGAEDSETDTTEQPEDVTDTEAMNEADDVENAEAADETADVENAETTDETTGAEDSETDTTEQPEDVTDTEAMNEADDVENAEATDKVTDAETTETDTTEQPEDVTNTETVNETADAEDTDTVAESDLENYDYETSSETQDSIKPETSGEFVSAENPYRERWEDFSDKFSGDSEADGWDSLKDVSFSGEEQADLDENVEAFDADSSVSTSDTTDFDGSSEISEINSLSDYMNAHNYGPDDFVTYSQDPQWRQLMSQEYPDYELPEMTQESAGSESPQDTSLNDSEKVLKRDEFDLLKSGNDAINQRLEAKADDYRDKGLSEEEISQRLAADKWTYQKEFLDEAFPGEDVSPNVFNGFSEHGAEDRIHEIEESPFLSELVTGNGTAERTDLNRDAVNDSASEYSKALKDFCESNGFVKNADFSDFDPHVAYDLAKSVVDAKMDFPDLDVNYLGSIDHQVSGLHDTVQAAQFDFYKQNGFDEDLAGQMAKQYADDFISNSGLNDTEGTYAWSLRTGNPALDKYDGVAVNNDYAEDYSRFKSEKMSDEIAKWAPVGCGSPKAVADHELGHEIDNLLAASDDSIINDLYTNMMKDNQAEEVLSGYSRTNVKEFIAEAYSEYRNNPKPRELSQAVYNRLIELRDQRVSERKLI